MTFEQWQATRHEVDDVSPVSQDDEPRPGYLYDGDSRFIWRHTRADGAVVYGTILTCAESWSPDLADVERDLYAWCAGSGDFGAAEG